MSSCRICLSKKPRKNISDLEIFEGGAKITSSQILLFCLDIKINEYTKQHTKLCVKCYKKVLDIYKFKRLALKNHAFLIASLTVSEVYINDSIKKEEFEISDTEDVFESNEIVDCLDEPVINLDIKHELKDLAYEPKEEQDAQSDDELLSVMKTLKYEIPDDETKENEVLTLDDCQGKKKMKAAPRKRVRKRDAPEKQVCEECGKYVMDIRAHRRTHEPKCINNMYQCDICKKLLSNKANLKKHIRRKHFGDKIACTICHKMVQNVKLHQRIMHDKESLKYQCFICKRRFISPNLLNTHITVHTKDRPYECDLCSSKFRLNVSLKLHKRQVHEKERSHLCQYCSKSFFKKNHLQIHLRHHTNERPYKCEKCHKAFKSRTQLTGHLETHSDVKKYACTLCDSTFLRKSYLTNHMKSHIKLKKYPCTYCAMKFHRSDHRRRHEYTAHLKHSLPNSVPVVTNTHPLVTNSLSLVTNSLPLVTNSLPLVSVSNSLPLVTNSLTIATCDS